MASPTSGAPRITHLLRRDVLHLDPIEHVASGAELVQDPLRLGRAGFDPAAVATEDRACVATAQDDPDVLDGQVERPQRRITNASSS